MRFERGLDRGLRSCAAPFRFIHHHCISASCRSFCKHIKTFDGPRGQFKRQMRAVAGPQCCSVAFSLSRLDASPSKLWHERDIIPTWVTAVCPIWPPSCVRPELQLLQQTIHDPKGAIAEFGQPGVVRHDQQRFFPAPRPTARSRSMMASPVLESRLPVGSSAKTMSGSFVRARAMATRCCSPPESSAGR